jgi:hypothetical protein
MTVHLRSKQDIETLVVFIALTVSTVTQQNNSSWLVELNPKPFATPTNMAQTLFCQIAHSLAMTVLSSNVLKTSILQKLN